MNSPADSSPSRPRVEGDREQEILQAALEVLTEVGYDRVTMDAVATRAKASKATLYRRWNSKLNLVIEALLLQKGPVEVPDTGTLRGDLISAFCGLGGIADEQAIAQFTAVLTALSRDHEFAEAYMREVIGPKIAANIKVYEQARERGELLDGVDIELLAPAIAGVVLHRFFVLGDIPTPALVTRVIDELILPAATGIRPDKK